MSTETATTVPEFVITADGELHGVDTPENREMVRRIRACVNACEGISTADLESNVVAQMVQIIQDVQPLLAGIDRDSEMQKAS